MKTASKKEKFILLRAEGLSYSKIATELGISKSTCTKWERDFSEQVRRAREERLEDLYTLYRVGKEAHIKKLGESCSKRGAGHNAHYSGYKSKRGSREKHNGFSHRSGAYP